VTPAWTGALAVTLTRQPPDLAGQAKTGGPEFCRPRGDEHHGGHRGLAAGGRGSKHFSPPGCT
jgi:hypothetical protein